MSERRFNYKHAVLAVTAAAGIGGGVATTNALNYLYEENTRNNQTIGRIDTGLNLIIKRPTQEELAQSQKILNNIEIELSAASDTDPQELLEASIFLASEDQQILAAKDVFSRETTYQNKRKAEIKAAGADDIDKRYLAVAGAGAISVVAAAISLGSTLIKSKEPDELHTIAHPEAE